MRPSPRSLGCGTTRSPRRHRSEPLAAVPFLTAIASGGSSMPSPGAAPPFPRHVVFTGYHGDKVWGAAAHGARQELVRTGPASGPTSRSTDSGRRFCIALCFLGARQQPLVYRDVSDRSRRRTRSALAEVRGDLHAGGWQGRSCSPTSPRGGSHATSDVVVARAARLSGRSRRNPRFVRRGKLLCLDELVRDPDFRNRSVSRWAPGRPRPTQTSRTTRNRASQTTWRK